MGLVEPSYEMETDELPPPPEDLLPPPPPPPPASATPARQSRGTSRQAPAAAQEIIIRSDEPPPYEELYPDKAGIPATLELRPETKLPAVAHNKMRPPPPLTTTTSSAAAAAPAPAPAAPVRRRPAAAPAAAPASSKGPPGGGPRARVAKQTQHHCGTGCPHMQAPSLLLRETAWRNNNVWIQIKTRLFFHGAPRCVIFNGLFPFASLCHRATGNSAGWRRRR